MDNKIELVKDMKKSYLDYAMSVIVGRALPDVRDGLKPVHRRILFSMSELGITYEKPYKKCARTVGDVLGKYHPHGDSSVYDALVRLEQDFVMRYPLIDGHGNFGSDDGDGAAAMRYTESRLAKISNQMLRDMNKDTVDFVPNFDGEEKEPTILPSRIPNLLVNGSTGIAVGFATNIPPHNLRDSINNVIYQIDNPNCNVGDLVDILKAPDFPTKAIIINPEEVKQIYSEGKGKIVMRGRYHIETIKKQKIIIFTEMPYGIDKASLKDKLHDLIHGYTKKEKEGKKTKDVFVPPVIPQIVEMKDDSDVRLGTRLMFVLKNNTDENIVLSLLFKHSELQSNFNANFTAVKGNELYQKMSLKDMNYYYIEHQKDVLTRRCKYDLAKAEKRIHILEGLKIAINNIDKVIVLIRSSKSTQEAKTNLTNTFNLSEKQTQAILDLKLQRLTKLEIDDVDKEYNDLSKTTKTLNKQLSNETELLNLLKTELIEIRDKYGDDRKTEIIYEDTLQEISSDELIEDSAVTLCLTSEGYIKKNLRYSENQKLKDGDSIVQLFQTTNRTDLLFFTSKGRLFVRKTYDLGECQPSQLGEYIPNILNTLQKDEKIIYLYATKDWSEDLICVFENGYISRMSLLQQKPQQNRKVAIDKVYNTKSPIISIAIIKNDIDIMLITQGGHSLIINTKDINLVKSKNSLGVIGIKLDIENMASDKLISALMDINIDTSFVLKTAKNKELYILLNDISLTNNKNNYDYYKGKRGRMGNFIYNCRQKNDKVIKVIVNSKRM